MGQRQGAPDDALSPVVRRVAVGMYVAVACFSGIGLIGKAPFIANLLHLPHTLIAAVLTAALLVPLFWQFALRLRNVLAPAACVGLLLAFFLVFPEVEALHSVGRGTDQPDCVILAAHHMLQGRWAYQSSEMWTKNPMSCGPGWVALQAPATVAAGYPANMLVIWAASLAVFILVLGWSTTAALLTLLAITPAFWLAASNGSDFLTFGIAAAAWLTACRRWWHARTARVLLAVLGALLGQFRMATLLLPVFQAKRLGRAATIVALLGSLLIQVGFLAWNAPGYIADGPLHVLFKLTHTHLIAGTALAASLELSVPVLLCGGALLAAARFYSEEIALLVYFTGIFVLPSGLDLIRKKHMYGTMHNMLQYWEGALWLMGFLPLLALLLVRGSEPGSRESAG